MLIDSHCHLDFPDFAQDLDQVIERAKAANVGHMLTIGTKLSKVGDVLAVADRFAEVWCTVGVHPHEAGPEEAELSVERLIELSTHPKVVGFGETGLDYFYQHSPKEAQERCFRLHIAAARITGLPVVVHTRDADRDTIRILEDEFSLGTFKALIHCYSSGPEVAAAAVAMGFLVSFSGILTFNKAEPLKQAARDLPLESLLVETDCPFLAPVPKRGKRNEPAFVAHVAAKMAQAKGFSLAEIESATTANFFRLFSKAVPG
jgi:TatD DNase family protein